MPDNIALNKYATASGSIAPFVPGRAVDGSDKPLNRWAYKHSGSSCWLQVDMGAPYWVNRWVVEHMAAVAGWPSNYCLSDYTLQSSGEGANWTIRDAVANNTLATTDRTVAPFYARYLRINVTGGLRINQAVASIMELQAYRYPHSPFLSALAVSSGALSPAFNPEVFSYAVSVDSTVASITLTPTAQDATSTIKVNNQSVPSGHPSQAIALNPGANSIAVLVTTQDGAVAQQYTVVVTRQAGQEYLTSLILKTDRGAAVPLNPTFNQNVFSYTASVGSGVPSVTVTPAAADSSASITVNGQSVPSGQPSQAIALAAGSNTITAAAASADGSRHSAYAIAVTRG